MNYENDIRIDETALDVEWLEQPSLMMKYAQISASARKTLDEAKEELEFVRAELDKAIRSNPDRYDIDKITEAVVIATITIHKDYQKASSALINAKYENDMAYGAVKAIDARKDALENLVRLHGQQYFAGPKVPRDLSFEAQQKHNQKKSDSVVKTMTRKNK
jgi:DNA polymerase II large subunit